MGAYNPSFGTAGGVKQEGPNGEVGSPGAYVTYLTEKTAAHETPAALNTYVKNATQEDTGQLFAKGEPRNKSDYISTNTSQSITKQCQIIDKDINCLCCRYPTPIRLAALIPLLDI